MNLRLMLSERLGRKAEPARPAPRPAPRLVRQARTLARASFAQLQLPLLSPSERLQLKRAAGRGVGQFLRALQKVVGRSARLQKGLGLAPTFVEDMAQVRASLLRIVGQAEEMHVLSQRGERQAIATLKQVLTRLTEVAERLAEEEALPPAERARAGRFVAFVRSCRQRAAEQAAAPALRGKRRVAKAEERARSLLKGGARRRMRAEILNLGAAPAPARPPAAPVALAPRGRRRSAEPDLMLGTPLDRCLGAEPSAYEAAAEALDEVLGQLGPEGRDPPGARGPADALLEVDLALLVLPLLPSLPWLTTEAGTSVEEVEELLDLQEAFCQLTESAGLLLRGARDGALLAAQLGLMVHEQAAQWLAGQGDAEAQELRQEIEEAAVALARSEDEKEAVLLRVERRIQEIEEGAAAELRASEYERTVAELQAGKEVDDDRLAAALEYRRAQAEAPPAPRGGRKRPR